MFDPARRRIVLDVPPTVRDAPFPTVFYDYATCRRRSLIDSSDAHLLPLRKAKMNVARVLCVARHGNENSSFWTPTSALGPHFFAFKFEGQEPLGLAKNPQLELGECGGSDVATAQNVW